MPLIVATRGFAPCMSGHFLSKSRTPEDRLIFRKYTPRTWTRLKWISSLVSDLIHCTNEPNVSIPQLANLLIERSQNTNWTVVFKALITVHHMMCYGNEVITFWHSSDPRDVHPFWNDFSIYRGSRSISHPATAHFSLTISSTRAAYKVIIL